MTRDSSNKLSKREQVKRSNKKAEANLKKKKNETSDSEDGNGSDSDDEMDMHEFRKYVQKIFPSKHLDKKIKAGEKLKKMAHEEYEEEEPVNHTSDAIQKLKERLANGEATRKERYDFYHHLAGYSTFQRKSPKDSRRSRARMGRKYARFLENDFRWRSKEMEYD